MWAPIGEGVAVTYIQVQNFGTENVIIDNVDNEWDLVLWKILQQFGQLGAADAVGTVDGQSSVDLATFERTDEGIGELLVVPGLADLTVGLGGVLGVDGSRQVVELGCGEDLVVDVLGGRGLECGGEGCDEGVARGSSIPAIDDFGRGLEIDLELGSKTIVDLDKLVVILAVDQLGGI
jgi:hypothetical protein